jgi:hypothetical protein
MMNCRSISRMDCTVRIVTVLEWLLLLVSATPADAADRDAGRQWQAGDHHVHSEWSVTWDDSTSPPRAIRGGDSPYTRSRNARTALANGLSWMVHTDHGGPGHSVVTRDHAWPALLQARKDVPTLIQFNGMEFDVPGGEHASVIVAGGADERDQLVTIEQRYGRSEPLQSGTREHAALMLEALAHMKTLPVPPVVFVNHPSRSATAVGEWGSVEPSELRQWHAAAPTILVGMEGAPGHQGAPGERGLYRSTGAPTFGGFDQMTARVGGVWDSMLADGVRFWITATSDSHEHLRDGGRDFDPGEYSKTHVWARPQAEDILDGLRHGRMFAVTGDLVDALELSVSDVGVVGRAATMGQTLEVSVDAVMRVRLKVRRPMAHDRNRQRPDLHHVELIVGSDGGDAGPQMQTKRFTSRDWVSDGRWLIVSWQLPVPAAGAFVRARGTNTEQRDPLPDPPGEDPWQDLWFYSNPVFVDVAR